MRRDAGATRRHVLKLTGAGLAGTALTGTVQARDETESVVFVHPSGNGADVVAAARDNNGRIVYDYANFDFIAVRIPGRGRASLERDERVGFVEDDGVAYALHHRDGHGGGPGHGDDDGDDDDGDDDDGGSGGPGNGNGNGHGRNKDDDDETAPPSVETRDPTNVTADGVTLNGELTDLGSAKSADVWIESRYSGEDEFSTFGEQTLRSAGSFSVDLGASANQEYDCRAVAETSDGKDSGDVVTFTTPEPKHPDQEASWGHDRVFGNSDTAKDETYALSTGDGVDVGILDSGIQADHDDLEANVADGVNYSAGAHWTDDDSGHGTHVAGIAGSADNGIGTIGVAPEASLWSVKVLHDGSGTWSDVIAGIDWCVSNDIEIISMSLGSGSEVDTVSVAIETAYAEGHLVVTSAGNSGNEDDGSCAEDTLTYPAFHEDTVAVAAMDPDDTLAWYSSVGPGVDIMAPGSSIRAPVPDDDYESKDGTSMAAPSVSGVAALGWCVLDADGPDPATRDRIEATIVDEAEPVLDTCEEGAGLVRADRVVRSLDE